MNDNWTLPFDLESSYQILENNSFLSPIINTLKGCNQGLWHKEGDVWEHTKLVLTFLKGMEQYKNSSNKDKAIIYLACLLHDVGKPSTTTGDGDDIESKDHSRKGARIARELMFHWNYQWFKIPFEIREEIANLVFLHMSPWFAFSKSDIYFRLYASSYVVRNSLLAILCEADSQGRICDENVLKHSIEDINLYTMLCEENGCLNQEKEFKSNNARFRYFFEKKGTPDIDYFEEVRGKVYVMSGLMGSGKDYIIKKSYPNIPVVSLDVIRENFDNEEGKVVSEGREQCKKFLRKGETFVFNATNIVKDLRRKWLEIFRDYKYNITIHYVERPLDIILKDNKTRTKSVPEEVILNKIKKIDIPTKMECHELIRSV